MKAAGWAAVAAAALLVASAVTAGMVIARSGLDRPALIEAGLGARALPSQALLAKLEAQGHDVTLDSDGDQLPDVLENFVYGSDAQALSTTGNGIPDGWFVRHGFDPTLPGIELEPAPEPPADELPAEYGGIWPVELRWTLGDLYRAGRPTGLDLNATWDNGIDPREPFGPGGLPYAWLAHHGLPVDADVSTDVLNGQWSVRESYEHGTDPHVADTDLDGLTDRDEIERHDTDPLRPSTTGSGVPDGWLVHFGLDPLDATLASRDVSGKGLSVRQTWEFDLERYGRVAALGGAGLDPTQLSHRGDGVPDGWLLAHGEDPLEDGVASRIVDCASAHDDVRDLPSSPANGAPWPLADLCHTVKDTYLVGRPDTWDEAKQGPWLGGLDPSRSDLDRDGLADVLEVRGWWLQRYFEVGPDAAGAWSVVASDPQANDTDQDGLLDSEEYRGRATRDGVLVSFNPSDPGNPDTAFSGLNDLEKVFGRIGGRLFPGLRGPDKAGGERSALDPTRADSAGSYVRDREYFEHWLTASQPAACEAYKYPNSIYKKPGEWMKEELSWAGDAVPPCSVQVERLSPDGDVDGDGLVNVADPDPSTPGGVTLYAGWKIDPDLLRYSSFNVDDLRQPLDPANPDTDGDGLPDDWELKHGVFQENGPKSYYDLDPAKHKSQGADQPVSDGEMNFNGDVVDWTRYYLENGAIMGTPCQYDFTNLKKFEAERSGFSAPPRAVLDKKADPTSVSAGWLRFWSHEYPIIRQVTPSPEGRVGLPTQACEKDAGILLPDLAGSLLFKGLIDRDVKHGQIVLDEHEYLRFGSRAPSASSSLPSPNPNDEEKVATSRVLRVDGQDVVVDTFRGTYQLTAARAARAGINPFMADNGGEGGGDTDGDLLTDAWEMHHTKACVANAPIPTEPDGGNDNDGDNLANVEEQALRTSPCLVDTRGDGMDDDEAAQLGDPTVPGSAADNADPTRDQDGDGIFDAAELQGTEPTGRSDPRRPDTAFSGLLDGNGQCLDLQTLDQNGAPVPNAITRDFLERGIAHEAVATSQCPGLFGTQHLKFKGSADVGRKAGIQVTNAANAPVPDGWLAKFGGSESLNEHEKKRYACGKPLGGAVGSWWDESRLGPWWWGLPRNTNAGCTAALDLDLDGLDDRNGEDPVPAGSQSNRPPTTPGAARAALTNDALTADQVLKLGQGFGECAGDVVPCRGQWVLAEPGLASKRVAATFTPVQLLRADNGPLPSSELPKETSLLATGRLLADCGGPCPGGEVALANRTIVVRMVKAVGPQPPSDPALRAYDLTDGSILGVGFTGPDGRFSIPVCLCKATGSADIPATGLTALGVLRGAAAASVDWQPAAARTPTGEWMHVVLHAYATPVAGGGTPSAGAATQLVDLDAGHPQFLQLAAGCASTPCRGNRAASFALDARQVATPSVTLVVQAPGNVAWPDAVSGLDPDRKFTVSIQATDASGAPLAGRTIGLAFTPEIPGADVSNLVTDPTGTVAREFRVASTGTAPILGPLKIIASFAAASAPAVTAEKDIVLQVPLQVTATVDATFDTGAPFKASVRVLSLGQPVVGADVVWTLGNLGSSARTDNTGRALITAALGQLEPGTKTFTATVRETEFRKGDQDTKQVQVLAGSTLQLNLQPQARAGQSVPITGSLARADGAPLADAVLQVFLDGKPFGALTSDANGQVSSQLLLPTDLAAGAHTLRVTYGGVAQTIRGTQQDFALFAQVASQVMVGASHAAPGGVAPVHGRLLDSSGRPLAGQAVHLSADGVPGRVAVTNSTGAFQTELQVPAGRAVQVVDLLVRYDGSRNQTYGPTQASSTLSIGSATRIEAGAAPRLVRGENLLVGRLLHAEQGTGVPLTFVHAVGGPVDEVVTTDDEGRFVVPVPISARRPGGAFVVRLVYDGDDLRGGTAVEVPLAFRPASALIATVRADVGRGTPVTLPFFLRDDAGNPVAGAVEADLAGVHGTATAGASGMGELVLDLPASLAPGPATLRASYAGNATHQPVSVAWPVEVKDGAVLRIDGPLDPVKPGAILEMRVTLTNATGVPIPGELVAVRMDGVDATLLERTGADGSFIAAATAPANGRLLVTAVFAGTVALAGTQAQGDALVLAPVKGSHLGWAWAAAPAALAVAAAAAAIFLRVHKPSPLQRVLRRSAARIRAGDPWGGAVLVAYDALQDHLARLGLAPGPDQTVRDVVRGVVAATKVEEAVAVDFVRLVEQARFSKGGTSAADAVHARHVLQVMLRSLPEAAA